MRTDRFIVAGESFRDGDLHLIGLELRVVDSMGAREEIAIVPLDLVLPRGRSGYGLYRLSQTLHTNYGDLNPPEFQL